jgi:two-component system phosphate regulon sensor histidine kinase PhoR
MHNFSPRKIAFYIALVPAILFGIASYFLYARQPFFILIVSGLMLAMGVVVYFVAYAFILNFILDKIKPIYRTLQNSRISSKALHKSIINNDFLSEVKNRVNNWSNDRREEIDQLKALEKYRREFLGNVSHELKTPIFNIQGYILTLLDGGLDDTSINRLYLERAEKSINRMICIVEDLESISRLESGELKLEPEDFNIVHLAFDVFEMQEMLANKQEIKLKFSQGYDKPIMVNADKKRIFEVMNNLVVNSIKYGKKGGSTTVSFYEMDDKVMVEVADTGIGIASKDQVRIFERFYRTDKSRSRDQGGTGLGLSIVKHIIEAHDQNITVKSKIGEGSTFTFSLNKA